MKILILMMVGSLCLFSVDLLKNINTLRMDFKQKITYNSGKSAYYRGTIHIKKPYSIKWEYAYPIKRNIYFIKNKITLDEPELEQVSYMKMDKNLKLFSIFKKTKKIGKNKYKANVKTKKYIIYYKNKNIQKIIFKDYLDNDVSISFSNHRKNIHYKNSFFRFRPPSFYDILD